MPRQCAENISLSEKCPNCDRRTFFKGDQNLRKRRYIPPAWFRDMFKAKFGIFPLSYFRIVRCEVCRRNLALFDANRGIMSDKVVALYACTLLALPLDDKDGVTCSGLKNCYNCPLKDSPDFVERK